MVDPPVRVLVIADDEDDFVLVRDLLSETTAGSHDVHWVKDHITAVELMVNGQYDVCLLDYRLGNRDGLKLMEKATARQCRLPVIILSAQQDYENDVKAMKAGAVDYLVKNDVTGPLLERSIRYAIERRNADVTDRKRAEARICLDDVRFGALFQLSHMTDASIDELEDFTLEQALRISGSTVGLIRFLNEDESVVLSTRWCRAILEQSRADEVSPLFSLDESGVWREAVRERRVVTINDCQAKHSGKRAPLPNHLQLNRLLAAPALEGDRVVAVMVLGSKTEPYDASDARHVTLSMDSMLKLVRNRRDRDALTRSEQQLRESNALLQKVFDGISDPLIMLNRDLSVSMLNKSALKYYGVEPSFDVLGTPCYESLCKQGRPCAECADFLTFIDVPAATFEREGIFDPSRFEQVVIYSVYGKDGKKDASIVRISDVTERRTMERQFIQNEKLASLGLLVSGITHEINNPNTFISFNLPILRDYLQTLMPVFDEYAGRHPDLRLFYMPYPRFRADLFKLLDNMEHGANRIAGIVSRLKSFMRKRDKSEFQRTNIGKLIEQTVSIAQPELTRTVKSFHVIVPEDLPEITTDPEAVQQVVLNLLINAAHACDKKDSEVTLKAGKESPDGQSLSIEVRDNGTGMDETIKKRIFDPFFTTKGPSSGTGLGLYICYNLLNNLGGRIEVESTPGQGSTFRAILTDQGPPEGV
jgi:signal transduction histidine kinase/DNA-binding response OmpR family regulator